MTSQIPFSKRYLKVSTSFSESADGAVPYQEALEEELVRELPPVSTQDALADATSVVATSKDTYSLRYFKVDQDEADDEE